MNRSLRKNDLIVGNGPHSSIPTLTPDNKLSNMPINRNSTKTQPTASEHDLNALAIKQEQIMTLRKQLSDIQQLAVATTSDPKNSSNDVTTTKPKQETMKRKLNETKTKRGLNKKRIASKSNPKIDNSDLSYDTEDDSQIMQAKQPAKRVYKKS